MGNECYYSLEKILSSRLHSKKLKVKTYKTINLLPVVLYGCETWSLTLKEENRLRVFENKVLRKIFGAKTKLQVNGESYTMMSYMHCSSPNVIRSLISRRLRWAGHVARMGQSRNAYKVLVRKPEGKISLGRPRHR